MLREVDRGTAGTTSAPLTPASALTASCLGHLWQATKVTLFVAFRAHTIDMNFCIR